MLKIDLNFFGGSKTCLNSEINNSLFKNSTTSAAAGWADHNEEIIERASTWFDRFPSSRHELLSSRFKNQILTTAYVCWRFRLVAAGLSSRWKARMSHSRYWPHQGAGAGHGYINRNLHSHVPFWRCRTLEETNVLNKIKYGPFLSALSRSAEN